MKEKTYSVDDVFGITRDLPLNYVERKSADSVLVNNLARKQHIVIYGSSKQGKTSLRKHALQPEDYIVIQCSNKWIINDLQSSILKKAGFEVTLSSTKTVSGTSKISATLKANFFGSGAEGGGEVGKTNEDSIETQPMELDPTDVNDIITALEGIKFNKFIVLEDFHYLPVETQKDFSVALKAYHENSDISFIVIGVWLEENRLSVYNGDLTGRLLPINADEWKREELKEVIGVGEALLNISFHESFKNKLLSSCYESVYIVQETCRKCCIQEGINETQSDHKEIGQSIGTDAIVKSVVNQQGGRFNSFLTQFAEGFQPTELEMYKWLLFPVINASSSELEKGFTQASIRSLLQKKHPKGSDLNPGNVTQSLQSVTSLQIKKDIKPIILDYDQTNLRLNIVDKSFIIWLLQQDKKSLLSLLDLPTK